jgi:hypothetical protein
VRVLVAYGVVLAALAFVSLGGPVPERGLAPLLALVLGGLAWCWCTVSSSFARVSLRWIVLGAIALRAVTWCGDPGTSDDLYRYIWEGEVVARGASPYAFAPDAAELAGLRVALPDLAARVAHPGVSAAYPPIVQLQNFLAVSVAHVFEAPWPTTARGLRALVALWDLLVIVPLVVLARAAGRPAAACVAWAWCPLVVLEFAGAGHFDSLGILLWVTSLTFARHAAPALAGAIAVKWLPLAGFPFQVRPRQGVLVLVLTALTFAPLAALEGGASGLFRGLGQYALRWESTSLVYRFLEPPLAVLAFVDPRVVGRGLIGLAWLGSAAWLWRRGASPVRAAFALTGLFLVLTPTLHPWYVTWIVPFLVVFPRPAWCWLVASAPLFYALLERWQCEQVWEEPAWVWPTVALPFFVLLLSHSRKRVERA